MFRKLLTIFFLLGLLSTAGAWAASYWNWEYTHWKTELALWGGTLVHRQHDAPPEKDAGWRCYGWISWPQTQWWPQRGSSQTHDWASYPLWIPTALLAVLYYGLKLILLLRSFYRELHDRCRVCGIEVQDSLLCCRKCQTPVSMLTVGRGAISQIFLHLLVLTIGLTTASYWHYSWMLNDGTTVAITRGSAVVSWAGGYRPAKHFAGFATWRTNWAPRFDATPFMPLGAAPAFGAPGPGVRTLIVPFWIPLGVIAYVVWRLRFSPANLRRRRIKLGLCLTCGYDLRASKERCPECGTKIAMGPIEDNATTPQPQSTSPRRRRGFLRDAAWRFLRVAWLVVTVALVGLWAFSYYGLDARRRVVYGYVGETGGAEDWVDDILCFYNGIAYLHISLPHDWEEDLVLEASWDEFPLSILETSNTWSIGEETLTGRPNELSFFEPSAWQPRFQRPGTPSQIALGILFSGHTFSLPLYLPVLILTIVPAFVFVRRRRRRRARETKRGVDIEEAGSGA